MRKKTINLKPPSTPASTFNFSSSKLPSAGSSGIGISSGSKLKIPGVKAAVPPQSSSNKLPKASNETSFSSSAASTTSTYASIKSASSSATPRSLKPPTKIVPPSTVTKSASSSRSNSQNRLQTDNSNSKMLKLFGKDKQKKVEDISIQQQSRSSSSNLLKPNSSGGKPKTASLKAPSALPTIAPSTSPKIQMGNMMEKPQQSQQFLAQNLNQPQQLQSQQQQQPALRLPTPGTISSGLIKPSVSSGLKKPSQLAPPSVSKDK
uniref:Ubinuclein-1 n=1 Tax=Panagrolaimus sp. PS1159 TaxID=55785 RepID=A0AC35GVN6_9BILA